MSAGLREVGVTRIECSGNDWDISSAPAKIAGHDFADSLLISIRLLRQERMQRSQHSGRTKSALQRMMLAESFLERAKPIGRTYAFDGDNFAPVSLHCKHETGSNRFAVDDDRTGATYAMLTTDVSTGETEIVPQGIRETRAQRHYRLSGHTIRNKLDFDLAHQLTPAPQAAIE
jgi:hypothetical protein